MTLASYSFLPWLRQGVANQITAPDGDSTVPLRAKFEARLQIGARALNGSTVVRDITRPVELLGPGDVIGIDPHCIIRTEPRRGITNFEPNYVPFVEFYDEDFPWRFTPAAPGAVGAATPRLRPWLTLLVLTEAEFEDGENVAGKPLPFIDIDSAALFPPANDLWAWAHVHINRNITKTDTDIVAGDLVDALSRFQAVLAENPDLAYARLVSPRRLADNTAYHAFLIPTFETGRLAGLGLDPSTAPSATHAAWAAYAADTRQEPTSYPYYYRWSFRTGGVGDFESLVRLLKPRPVDSRVGTRDIDVLRPGMNLPPIDDPELGGVLKLGGALRVPRAAMSAKDRALAERYDAWDEPYPQKFQTELASFINLADDYAEKTALAAHAATPFGGVEDTDPDPMITPPLYGRWHALTSRLLKQRNGSAVSANRNWLHQLNLDPRDRTTAAFGTKIVQSKQEELMEAAWQQVGDILEANRRLRLLQLAKQASLQLWNRHLVALAAARPERAFVLTTPIHRRLTHRNDLIRKTLTVQHQLARSVLSTAITSAAMRRVIRPGGRLMRSLPFDATVTPDNLLARVNAGKVSAAPPRVRPPGLVTIDDIAGGLIPRGLPDLLVRLLRRWPWLWLVLLLLALVALAVAARLGSPAHGRVIAAVLAAVAMLARTWSRQIRQSDSISEDGHRPETVASMPSSSDFRIEPPGSVFRPHLGGVDSIEARRFKKALVGCYGLAAASKQAAAERLQQNPLLPISLRAIAQRTLAGIDPAITIPRHILATLQLPKHIAEQLGESFTEVMVYPEIDTPMYEPLAAQSPAQFVPGLHLIPENSLTLLETNQRFIEAYMVGLNHEFARELLWREYPTDQRGSYFRQFWDVSSYLDTGLPDAARRESLKDISPIHLWSRASKLGRHDNRQGGPEDIVLVIRGELLKKYPNAVIYARRAQWQTKNGAIDPSQARRLVPLTDAEQAHPPRTKLKAPLYQAKIDPDLHFLGFDLTVVQARGGTGAQPTDDPGWFFVIEERPGEPRFGLDESRKGALNVWNDLAWTDVLPGGGPGAFIPMSTAPTLHLVQPVSGSEKVPQYNDDKNVAWGPATSAADIAYIMLQAPVLVAIHAAEMLPKPS